MVVRLGVDQWDCKQRGAHSVGVTERHHPKTLTKHYVGWTHSKMNALSLRTGLGDICGVQNTDRGPACTATIGEHVVHLAGVVAGGAVFTMSRGVWEISFQSKASGFHQLEFPIVFKPPHAISLFSSLAACLGSLNSISYSATNGRLNNIAGRRQQFGDVFQSIQWGPWLEAGMASHDGTLVKLGSQGFVPIEPTLGLVIFAALGFVQKRLVGVFPTDWSKCTRVLPYTPHLHHISSLLWFYGAVTTSHQGNLPR